MTEKSNYADSKLLAIKKLKILSSNKIVNYFLPSVYHEKWSGNLRFLNYLPKKLSLLFFPLLSSFKPTIHLEKVARAIIKNDDIQEDNEFYFSNNLDNNTTYKMFKRFTDIIFCLSVTF